MNFALLVLGLFSEASLGRWHPADYGRLLGGFGCHSRPLSKTISQAHQGHPRAPQRWCRHTLHWLTPWCPEDIKQDPGTAVPRMELVKKANTILQENQTHPTPAQQGTLKRMPVVFFRQETLLWNSEPFPTLGPRGPWSSWMGSMISWVSCPFCLLNRHIPSQGRKIQGRI